MKEFILLFKADNANNSSWYVYGEYDTVQELQKELEMVICWKPITEIYACRRLPMKIEVARGEE